MTREQYAMFLSDILHAREKENKTVHDELHAIFSIVNVEEESSTAAGLANIDRRLCEQVCVCKYRADVLPGHASLFIDLVSKLRFFLIALRQKELWPILKLCLIRARWFFVFGRSGTTICFRVEPNSENLVPNIKGPRYPKATKIGISQLFAVDVGK